MEIFIELLVFYQFSILNIGILLIYGRKSIKIGAYAQIWSQSFYS